MSWIIIRVDINRADNEQRYIPEIPCHISSEVRGYNILNQEPSHISLNSGCWSVADTLILTSVEFTQLQAHSTIGGIERLYLGRDEFNVFLGS